jgi:hypothetical protein
VIAVRRATRLHGSVPSVVRWYIDRQGSTRRLPFYCDPARVGAFAVLPVELAAGSESALFRLFVMLSMYQALRDVVIMRQQRAMRPAAVRLVADVAFLSRSVDRHGCSTLRSADGFDEACDVSKSGRGVDCATCPGVACHVKDASSTFNRMGDMGKLPTSAWLRLWRGGGIRKVLADVCSAEASPTRRATLLVARLASVHRVGRKLATMFASALSTPVLAPGLTPWFPDVDGNDLVVIDTNVARAVDALREPGAPRTYDVREQWVRAQAALLDLRAFRADLPRYSPRFVQEALYAFGSKSNRVAQGDPCARGTGPCATCVPRLCPFRPSPSGTRAGGAAARSADA